MCVSSESRFFDNIDLLGGKVSYKIDGRSTYKNVFGSVLTIIIIFIFTYFIFEILTPFIYREVPRIAYENFKDYDPPMYKLKENYFFIGYKIKVGDKLQNDLSSYLDISTTYNTVILNKNKTVTKLSRNIKTRPSLENDLNGGLFLYDLQNMAQAESLRFDDDMKLQGSTVSSEYNFIKIDINLLKNSDNPTYQKDVENLFALGGSFQIYYTDLSVRLTNYTHPYSEFVSYYSDSISLLDSKSLTIDTALNGITLDSAYLFESSLTNIIKPSHLSSTLKSSRRTDNNLSLYSTTIQVSKQRYKYVRDYMKIPELLALIGGMITVTISIFKIFNNYVNDYLFHIRMIENILNFDPNYDKNIEPGEIQKELFPSSPTNKRKGSKLEFSNLTLGPEVKNGKLNVKGDLSNDESVSEINKDHPSSPRKKVVKKVRRRGVITRNPFFKSKDSILELFLCCFRRKKTQKRNELYIKARQRINNYMDIVKVTKKLIEIDLLKYLILSPEQITLCTLIGKPYITLNEETLNKNKFSHSYLDYAHIEMMSDYDVKNLPQVEKNKIYSCFQKVNTKATPSIIDKKLVSSTEDNMDLIG